MRRIISFVIALALALCIPAFAEELVFTVGLDGDIVALDPAYAYDFTTNPVINQICQGIVAFDENNQIVPKLAESWEAVDDTTYVYKIRSDVKFSDGSPMTMEDVLFSLARHKDAAVGSYLGWMFDAVESIEQTGEWELTVKLTKPSATWQYVLGTAAGQIISKAACEAAGDLFGTAEGGLIGTGPYIFESWKSGQEITLVKNQNYWEPGVEVAIDTLIFKVIPEDVTRITALQAKQVDCAFILPADMLDILKACDHLTVEAVETFGLTYLAMNVDMAPLNEVNVRKAIYHAIDFEAIAANIIKEAGQPGTVIPHSESLYTINPEEWEAYAASAPVYEYNVEKAKGYLAESSVPEGFSTTLITNEDSLRYSICLAIQEYLSQVNINVEILKVSSDEHTNYQMGGVLTAEGIRDYGMLIGGWESDYPDISGNLEPLYAGYNTGDGGCNAACYANEEVDALLRAQNASTDPAERNQLMFQALDIVTDEIPYINIQYPVRNIAVNNAFEGFSMTAAWTWNLDFSKITPAA